MNPRTLTAEQIDKLLIICNINDVYHYDIQIELIDHMATAIEKRWETNPELSFEEALKLVEEQLGGEEGFNTIKKAKEKEIKKKYSRLRWKYIGEFFQLPKIILTIAITISLFLIFRYVENNAGIRFGLQVVLFLLMLIQGSLISPRKFRLDLVPGKSFLLVDQLKSMERTIRHFILLPMMFINLYSFEYFNFAAGNTIFWELLNSFLITFMAIILVVVTLYIPRRIKEDFILEYPQFVKS
jgi:hypothetical protein